MQKNVRYSCVYIFEKCIIIGGMNMIFGIDFDGTLSFGQWPEVGPANHGLIDFLKIRKMRGTILAFFITESLSFITFSRSAVV